MYYDQDYLSYRTARLNSEVFWQLVIIAFAVVSLAITAGIVLTQRKACKSNEKLWDAQSKRLLINLFIPLVAGGALCLILLEKGLIGLVAPLTLVFYGLALVNASKYTSRKFGALASLKYCSD